MNIFLHFSVTVRQQGQERTYGFGPDPEKMFPWQAEKGEGFYLWPFYSPGQITENPKIGLPILTTKDPERVKRTLEWIEARQKDPSAYSIAGIDCMIWAIAATQD